MSELNDRPRRRRKERAPGEALAIDIENSLSESDGVDRTFAKIVRESQARKGSKKVYVSAGTQNRLIGVPLPSLALCYAFQSNVLPLSRIVQIPGPPGSCKSMLLYEMARWILMLRGAGYYFENELKDAPILRHSIFEHREQFENNTLVIQTESMDEWMREFTVHADFTIQEHEGKATSPGWRFPYFFLLDSLMSTPTEETLAKQKKEGVGRGYAIEANYLARFARGLPEVMGQRPFLFAVTNHYKPSKDPATGMIVRNIPGGEAFKFMESAELELSRIKDIKRAEYEGVLIKLRAYKNCFGSSRRWIQVPVVWRHEVTPDLVQRQWTMWDWYTATINLFETLRAKEKGLWNRLNEVVDFRVERNRVWSRALGIEKADAVSTFEAGWQLEQRPDLLEQLYAILHIFRGRFFLPGMDYQAMLNDGAAGPSDLSERNYSKPIAAGMTVETDQAGESALGVFEDEAA